MSETRYIISDAAKMIDVEPHVLRYWEEELGMEIPRNEMGHRYYTDREVKLFTMVRDLKDKGFQLKAIKMVLSALSEENEEENKMETSVASDTSKKDVREDRKGIISLADIRKNHETEQETQEHKQENKVSDSKNSEEESFSLTKENKKSVGALTAEDKMNHFKYMMDAIMMQALKRNNQTLEAELVNNISDKVIKEMDYLFRVQEEKEEARYKNIDEMIRKKQKGRKEAAAAKAPVYGPKKSRRRLF